MSSYILTSFAEIEIDANTLGTTAPRAELSAISVHTSMGDSRKFCPPKIDLQPVWSKILLRAKQTTEQTLVDGNNLAPRTYMPLASKPHLHRAPSSRKKLKGYF